MHTDRTLRTSYLHEILLLSNKLIGIAVCVDGLLYVNEVKGIHYS